MCIAYQFVYLSFLPYIKFQEPIQTRSWTGIPWQRRQNFLQK